MMKLMHQPKIVNNSIQNVKKVFGIQNTCNNLMMFNKIDLYYDKKKKQNKNFNYKCYFWEIDAKNSADLCSSIDLKR